MVFQETIKLAPQEKGATEITDLVNGLITDSGIVTGICQLFVHNNHSGLIISDTADEHVRNSTEEFMAHLAPTSDHSTKIIDDSMDAIPDAMRAALMHSSISLPVRNKHALLGAWQGIFLWERRAQPEERNLTVTIMGE